MSEIKESVLETFIGIKKELDSNNIFKENKKITEYLLRAIYKRWGQSLINDKLNYNFIALSFNKVYFWKNLLKSIVFFDLYFELIDDSILDVGCGAAPVSIAIASLAKNRKRGNISIFLIDKSKNQLSIAKDFTQAMSIEIESFTEGFFDIKHEKYSQLVIFSYFFCEQKKDFLKILFNNRKKFSKGFVVIDHKNNIIILEEYFKNNGDYNIESISVNYSIPDKLVDYVYDKEVNVYGCFYRP